MLLSHNHHLLSRGGVKDSQPFSPPKNLFPTYGISFVLYTFQSQPNFIIVTLVTNLAKTHLFLILSLSSPLPQTLSRMSRRRKGGGGGAGLLISANDATSFFPNILLLLFSFWYKVYHTCVRVHPIPHTQFLPPKKTFSPKVTKMHLISFSSPESVPYKKGGNQVRRGGSIQCPPSSFDIPFPHFLPPSSFA